MSRNQATNHVQVVGRVEQAPSTNSTRQGPLWRESDYKTHSDVLGRTWEQSHPLVVHADTLYPPLPGTESHGVMAIMHEERDIGTPLDMYLPLTMSDVMEMCGVPHQYKSHTSAGAQHFLGQH